MFTGIIELAGTMAGITVTGGGARLVVDAPNLSRQARIGDSVAVNGVCLTVIARSDERIAFDAVNETLTRSNLGTLRVGDRVNLERPLRADGRYDGHVVQGHVDTTAVLLNLVPEGVSRRMRFQVAPATLRYVVEKGSVTIDGISLTTAALGEDWLEVVVIPHTWEITNLSARRVGDRVNIEVDVIAKYVERLLAPWRQS